MSGPAAGVDLGPTNACPLADRCESCGTGEDLTVAAVGTEVGVYCLTLCADCAQDGLLPDPGGFPRAAERVMEHCEHLGIDVDQMAAALEAERSR